MPIRKFWWYSVSDCGGDDSRFQLDGIAEALRDVAVDAAEDYHSNHDGWESHWPLMFTIYESEEGPPVARFEVERETVPAFHAWDRTETAVTPERTPR